MSKYNRAVLPAMAKILVKAKKAGDGRYVEFVRISSLKSGLSSDAVERRITEYAAVPK